MYRISDVTCRMFSQGLKTLEMNVCVCVGFKMPSPVIKDTLFNAACFIFFLCSFGYFETLQHNIYKAEVASPVFLLHSLFINVIGKSMNLFLLKL